MNGTRIVCTLSAVLTWAVLAGCATGDGRQAGRAPSADERRVKIDELRERTLADLYAEKPETKAEIQSAVGYAVFDASQVNLVLFVGALGAGVVVENGPGQPTYMKMTRAGTGPGIGFKSYRQVLVFKDRQLFDTFRKIGADVNVSGDATAKLRGKGASLDGSVSFNPLLSVYHMTDRGLLLQANWGGVAYLPDAELNR